tara:strand:- start:962 stop:1465 length:504 start_codon:yes stop_codon:yes gene_type:complete
MSDDIDEMERMLDDYLQFAKNQTQESSEAINVIDLFNEIVSGSKLVNLNSNISNKIFIVARKNALKRCFQNLIQNGLCYGKNVFITLSSTANWMVVLVEDDGPGIPEEEYKNVFKPFHRLDESRSLNKSGVGLGLSISEDIINSHGGTIQLSKSSYSGLQVKVSLPF